VTWKTAAEHLRHFVYKPLEQIRRQMRSPGAYTYEIHKEPDTKWNQLTC
jgi:hypothetical protein